MTAPSLDPVFCARLNFGLVHSLWQTSVLAMAAVTTMPLLRARSANVRYAVLLAAELLAIILFAITIGLGPSERSQSSTQVTQRGTASAHEQVPTGLRNASADSTLADDPSAVGTPDRQPRSYVMVGYLLGVALMLLRLAIGLWGGRRMVHTSKPITHQRILKAIADAAEGMELAYVPAVAYCSSVVVPSVLGVLRPMLLLPFSVVSGLTPEQVEVLVMHEFAHIRRQDHIFNLLQRVVEAFLFFHPLIWYLSWRIRQERELCCDDLVLAAGRSADTYARSLIRMAELGIEDPIGTVAVVTLAASGDRSTLRHRVMRLLGHQQQSPPVRLRRIGSIVASTLVMMFVLSSLLAMRPSPYTGDSSQGVALRPSDYRQRAPSEWPDLHAATAYGTVQEITMILNNGVDVDLRSPGGFTAAHFAAATNRRDVLALLLKAGASINALSEQGRTPLDSALGVGPVVGQPGVRDVDSATVEFLLQHGADPNLPDNNGGTALHRAVARRDLTCIEAMLNAGADPNIADIRGRTPLHDACALAELEPGIIRLMLAHGADAKRLDVNGWSTLDVLGLQTRPWNENTTERMNQCAKVLINAGATADLAASVVLAFEQDVRSVLIADPSLVNRVPAKSQNGNTLLHHAAISGNASMCQLLLQAGASVNAVNHSNQTALYLAANRRTPAIGVVRTLLRGGALVEPLDTPFERPLSAAVIQKSPEVLRMLLDAGAQVDAADRSGQTPLHRLTLAEARDPAPERVTMAEMLLAAKADVNKTDQAGSSPLHVAIANSLENLVRLYLQSGGNPNAPDQVGRTPLLLALTAHHPSYAVIKSLVDAGADANIKNTAGQSAMDLAASSNSQEIRSVLRQSSSQALRQN
jgi:ankyrin repeat protein/beta-lactamase regulating signal transducer with metallopeptidase domain